jgi:hypothetical protein
VASPSDAVRARWRCSASRIILRANSVISSNKIFLTWESHQRTRSVAARLGLNLLEILVSGPRHRRYCLQILTTIRHLTMLQPKLIVVQNPSLVLTVLVLLWRIFMRAKCTIVMDAHNEAIEPMIHPWARHIARWCVRRCDFTIVTNRFLAVSVMRQGGCALILPDPLPDIEPVPARALRPREPLRILVVATYEKDEPIAEILQAAGSLIGVVEFRFTGNYHKLPSNAAGMGAPNVFFTGFLPRDAYWREMADSHAVMDLTLLDNCLVCGAYEAVAMRRPMILSDTRALREHFHHGAIFTQPCAKDITGAIKRLRTAYRDLPDEVSQLAVFMKVEEKWRITEVLQAVTQ